MLQKSPSMHITVLEMTEASSVCSQKSLLVLSCSFAKQRPLPQYRVPENMKYYAAFTYSKKRWLSGVCGGR